MLGLLAISAVCLTAYGLRSTRIKFPLLQLALFRIRTFRASITGNFFTRLGIGGIPFLFPLLYQVGLGFTPISVRQLPIAQYLQALAAMSLKMTMPKILRRFGYRNVLVSNTMIIGVLIVLFATIGPQTPIWLIVVQVFVYGFFTSLQYTSIHTFVYADIWRRTRQQRQHDYQRHPTIAPQLPALRPPPSPPPFSFPIAFAPIPQK